MITLARCLAASLLTVVLTAVPGYAQIDIVEVTSPKGITAWLYEDHSIPILSVEVGFRGGTSLDPEGSEGVTTLMAGTLEEGAGDLDAIGFAEAAESLGARFSFDASRDFFYASALVLSESREASLELFRSALTEPRFDEDPVERVRAQLMSSLRSAETDPDRIARDRFYASVYKDHVYGRPGDGTLKSVGELSIREIRAAHLSALAGSRMYVAVVGDITAAELAPLLDEMFAEIPDNPLERAAVARPYLAGTVSVVDLGIPQSVVLFGQSGLARNDPDFIPAFVLNQILGAGGFGSRLTEELREKRGLTYGIYTYLQPNDLGWLIVGGFSSANERVAEAIGLVREEWDRMLMEGVSEQELADAKKYLTGAYPLRFDGNQKIASQLLGIQTAGLGIDYVNKRNSLVDAVTLGDIERVAQRLLRPGELTWVVVGRPEGLEHTN